MRRIAFIAAVVATILSTPAFAADELLKGDLYGGKVAGGVTDDGNKEVRALRVDPTSVRLKVESISPLATLVNGVADIPAAGATDRTQLPSNTAYSCTLQAPTGNAGPIYVGGSTVTNSSGANEGISLAAGDAIGPISVTNSNLLYVATDNAGDDVKYLCN